jgi:hypothetical protein
MEPKKMKLAQKSKAKTGESDLIQETEKLAYTFYMERMENNQPGDEMSDWAAAENHLRMKRSA